MKYYQYDKNSLEYKNQIEVKEGREPANAIKIEPPLIEQSSHCIFDIKTKNWKVISKKEFVELQISLGQKEKLSDFEKLNDLGEKVSKTRLELFEQKLLSKDKILRDKLYEISSKAKEKIESGFESKAKGQFYIYDSKLEDQLNIQTLALASKDTVLRCTKKSDSVKDFYPHTADQLKKIVEEFTIFKSSILKKAHDLKTDLNLKSAIEIENVAVEF